MKEIICISMIILTIMITFTPFESFAAHNPVFTWQVRGDVNYQQWIYDGDDPIALFDMSTMDEPMQALMMFQKVPRPILLKYLKLKPGGRPLVQAVQLFWRSGKIITDVLDGLTVEGNGTDRLKITFSVKDEWDTIKVTRTITVSYDNTLNSYVYDFSDHAVINFPETLDNNNPVQFEIIDPWFVDCPAPSQKFTGAWKGRYSMYAYESRDGRIISIPHTHYGGSQKEGIVLKKDGIFVAIYEPDGNPAIQLIGDTALKSTINICHWAYDVHVSLSVSSEELYAPIITNFKIFQCLDDKAQTMEKKAEIPALKPGEYNDLKEIPMYERISSFEKAISLGKPHEGETDPWGWIPQDEKGAVWEKSFGRTGSRSLKIDKDTRGISTWYNMCEGQGYFTEPWTPCKGYEISCWVKTQDVTGPGASIGACYHVPNVPPEWPITRSERVNGTRDWTKLIVRIGPPPKDTSIMSLHLQQAGSGTTWFDDIEVKMIK